MLTLHTLSISKAPVPKELEYGTLLVNKLGTRFWYCMGSGTLAENTSDKYNLKEITKPTEDPKRIPKTKVHEEIQRGVLLVVVAEGN